MPLVYAIPGRHIKVTRVHFEARAGIKIALKQNDRWTLALIPGWDIVDIKNKLRIFRDKYASE